MYANEKRLETNIPKLLFVNSYLQVEELKVLFKLLLHYFLFSKMLISERNCSLKYSNTKNIHTIFRYIRCS